MYKTLVRNMVSRRFRGKGGASTKRFTLKQTGKIIAAQQRKKRERQLTTEPELISALGNGPTFVSRIYRKYRTQFKAENHEPKRCSAFLNHVAKSRMLNGSLWSDKAVESMFRRAEIMERRKK